MYLIAHSASKYLRHQQTYVVVRPLDSKGLPFQPYLLERGSQGSGRIMQHHTMSVYSHHTRGVLSLRRVPKPTHPSSGYPFIRFVSVRCA